MDSTIKKSILLGFFVLIGIILFIIGIFQIGAKNEMFEKTFPITAKFTNATGLKLGSNVRYNGVKVGIVKTVKLINDTLVQVDMQIEESKRSFIHKDAIATISSDGLMGDKLISIIPGKNNTGQQIQNFDLLQTHNPLNTEEVLQTLSESNENIKVITENLKMVSTELTTKNGPAQMLYKDTTLAKNLKQSFINLDAITGKVLIVSNTLENITMQIQNGDGALGKIINDTGFTNNLTNTFNKLNATSNELNRVSNGLSIFIEHANTSKGAINMLLADTAFAANVQQSMQNIKKASIGLNQNMEALKHNFLTRSYFRKQEKINNKIKESENK